MTTFVARVRRSLLTIGVGLLVVASGAPQARSTNPNALYIQATLGNPATRNVTSSGGQSALLSYFGKADYNFQDKYVASVTLRRDGSSRLGPDHRWGTFPAFGLGWRGN